MGDSAAAYCPGDDTIYVSQQFATDIYNGALDHALPGSSQGYGRTIGDFAVAYIVAHEYAHQIQDELGALQQYGQRLPTMAFELQADCYAGRGPRARPRRTASRTATCRRRSTPPSPWATSTPETRATTARPNSARRLGPAASRRATRPPAVRT